MVSFFLSHVPEKVYFQCILKHLINPQERQPLMFSYSTSFDIHRFICGDIFQPNSRFCVPTQFMQKQTNTCEEKNTCQNKKIHVRTKNTCEKNKQTHVRTKKTHSRNFYVRQHSVFCEKYQKKTGVHYGKSLITKNIAKY